MRKLITKEYVRQFPFYQMPKAFFNDPKYMSLRCESKLAYMLMLDLLSLSIENNWVNENNEVFVKLSRTKLMSLLHIGGTQKAAQVIKELVNHKLIISKKVGYNRCNEIYLYQIEEVELKKTPFKKPKKAKSPEVSVASVADERQALAPTSPAWQKPVQARIEDEQDVTRAMIEVEELLISQIHIDDLKQRYDHTFVDEIVNNIYEMYLNQTTPIGKQDKPRAIVRDVIRKLKMYHIEHVIDRFIEISRTTKILNIKRYLQTMIYNSIYEANSQLIGHIKHHTTLTW